MKRAIRKRKPRHSLQPCASMEWVMCGNGVPKWMETRGARPAILRIPGKACPGSGSARENALRIAAPGRWNDPDMLVVGWVGWGPALHYTRLTPDEQYTHISLWCLLSSPLLIGCDLNQLDPFTLNLLTNDEVLAVNQDPLGKQAIQVKANVIYQVWVKELEMAVRQWDV